jgi:hypothetical protein
MRLEKVFHQEQCQKLLEAAIGLKYNRAPSFLGNFEYLHFTGERKIQGVLGKAAGLLAKLEPQQSFTDCFLQRYFKGHSVKEHRDPYNNKGVTIIAYFGSWTGGEVIWGGVQFCPVAGDAIIAPCTINGIQGAKHQVLPITGGQRYALILNTITR